MVYGATGLLRHHLRDLGVRANNKRETTKFDQDSGQVYMESTARVIRPEDRNWTELSEIQQAKFEKELAIDAKVPSNYERKYEKATNYLAYLKEQKKKQDPWPQTGSRSLVDMMITVLVENIEDLNLSILEILPIQVLLKVWRQINRHCLSNFATWKNFSKLIVRNIDEGKNAVLPCDFATFDLYRYEQCIRKPILPLLDYIEPLTSPSFDFITFLSISQNLPTAQLLKLTKLRNIGALHLIYTKTDEESYVNDRLLRAWSQIDGAFPVLRLLNLWNFPEITIQSLQWASKFPALGLLHIRQSSCKLGAKKVVRLEAQKQNWKCEIQKNPLHRTTWKEEEKDFDYSQQQTWNEQQVMRSMSDESPDEIHDWTALPSFQKLGDSSHQQTYMGRCYDHNWQIYLHSQFTSLGRIRSDRDLENAGVKLQVLDKGADGKNCRAYQTFYVKGWPIPPIPTATIFLGEQEDSTSHSEPCLLDFLFTRIELPAFPEERESVFTTSTKRSESTATVESSLKMRPRKIMKLDSVWKTFL